MTDSDFHPTANGEMMRWRAALLKRVREFFESRDFLEVETPLLSHDTVVDRFIEPYAMDEGASDRETLWLQTSPEFAMKRLLAAGEERIFQIAKAFRREEAGSLHNPEFTILEWYRTGDSYRQGRELLADFCRDVVDATQVDSITYRAAMQQFAGVDPFDASVADLVAAGGEQSPATTDRDEALNYLLAMKVEPNLGAGAPVILYDYPASQAALARVRDEDPPVAERFELYWKGIELANGYHELLDPAILRQRNRTTNQQRQAAGQDALPEESRLLAAMDHGLPPCVGVALGIDRLLMVAAGAKSIQHVIAFPIDRA